VTDLTVRLTGLDPIARRFTNGDDIVADEAVVMVDRLTIAGSTEAKRHVGVRTGTGRRSLAHEPARRAGRAVVGAFGTNVPYMRIHNDGRGPVVARGRALRFTIGGVVFFRKRVGPAKGRRFMEKGAAEIRRRTPAETAACARRITARLRAG
jgi:hypothetical protein